MTEHSITYDGAERRNGDRPLYCYEEHLHLAKRIGDVETEVKVIRSEFMGVKDQVFAMQGMMTQLGRVNNEINNRMTQIEGGLALVNSSVSNLEKIITIRREFLPELAKMVLTSGGILGMAWGLFKVIHGFMR